MEPKFKVGSIVEVAEWIGVVCEVLHAHDGRLFLKVQSPRNIHRRMVGEYIEVGLNPDMVKLATVEDLQREIAYYRNRFDSEVAQVCKLALEAI